MAAPIRISPFFTLFFNLLRLLFLPETVFIEPKLSDMENKTIIQMNLELLSSAGRNISFFIKNRMLTVDFVKFATVI